MNTKELVYRYKRCIGFGLKLINYINFTNRFRYSKYKKNSIKYGCVFLSNVKISVEGNNNLIIIEDLCILKNCQINIYGNNNTININKECFLNGAEFYVEDNNNDIVVGFHSSIHGKTHLAAIEGTQIIIGEDCMFSSDVQLRTGDSHSIVNLMGERINSSKNIEIGNHVWIGTKVICLKGTKISDNSVVAAGSLLTKNFDEKNCLIAGHPAKIIKKEINWLRERI